MGPTSKPVLLVLWRALLVFEARGQPGRPHRKASFGVTYLSVYKCGGLQAALMGPHNSGPIVVAPTMLPAGSPKTPRTRQMQRDVLMQHAMHSNIDSRSR
jgi:hypothetical protein